MDFSLIFELTPVLAKHPALVQAFTKNLPTGEKFINEVQALINKPEYQALFKAFEDNTPEAQAFINEIEAVLQHHYHLVRGDPAS